MLLVAGLSPAHVGSSHGLALADWWRHWELRPSVLLPLVLAGLLYARGWLRLSDRARGHFGLWRLVAYASGLLLVATALLSGVDSLGEQLFAMHMVQHLILTMLAAPLLLLAAPYPCMIWGLPERLRRRWTAPLRRHSILRRLLSALARPQWVLALYVGLLWAWHTPAGYQAALRHPRVHDLEHLSFFGSAMLFWWVVLAAAPRLQGRLSLGSRLGLLVLAFIQNEILGIVIAMADAPIYPYYAALPRLQGISVMDDQMMSGLLMWIPGGMMYGLATILTLAHVLGRERPPSRAVLERQFRAHGDSG
jgi:cytochrome c oxidase assembly factor CtaG